MAFEEAVLSQLIVAYEEDASAKKGAGGAKVTVLANAAFSYSVIRNVARETAKWAQFKKKKKVQGLQFSNQWVHGVIRRAGLQRKRVQASDVKKRPTVAEVQANFKEFQKMVEELNIPIENRASADETGIVTQAPAHKVTTIIVLCLHAVLIAVVFI